MSHLCVFLVSGWYHGCLIRNKTQKVSKTFTIKKRKSTAHFAHTKMMENNADTVDRLINENHELY